jgi:hypothetical protein
MKLPRFSAWLSISLALAAAVAITAPHQLGISVYKLSLVTVGAWVGYWIDRGLFPYARPHQFLGNMFSPGSPVASLHVPISKEQAQAFAASMMRRALIIASCILGMTLGA